MFSAVSTFWGAGSCVLLRARCHASNARSTWYESTPLDVVRDEWDEATFEARRAATRATLGERR